MKTGKSLMTEQNIKLLKGNKHHQQFPIFQDSPLLRFGVLLAGWKLCRSF